MKHDTSTIKLDVIARAPFHKYYEGPAIAVSASNQVGQFDILPGHTDFFSVMTPGEVVIQTEKDIINFQISNGIITVRGDQVMLFVNI
jgi:F0F1-type ATP synthase epsilon subunit